MSSKYVLHERENFLDIAKGISIIVVMLVHSCGIPMIGKYMTGFFLPIFFVITGYLYKKAPLKLLIKKRIKQILLPYFMANAILLTISYVELIIQKKINMKFIIDSIIGVFYGRYMLGTELTNPIINFELCHNHPLWFMPAMLCSCILFYIVKACIAQWKWYKYLLIEIVCVISLFFLNKLPILLPWSLDTMPAFLLFMLLGDFIKNSKYIKAEHINRKILIYACFGILYLILCKLDCSYNIAIRNYGKYGIIIYIVRGGLGSVLLLEMAKWLIKFRISVVGELIGRNTMSLMCWHVLLLNCTPCQGHFELV